jgi:hypothetical protein
MYFNPGRKNVLRNGEDRERLRSCNSVSFTSPTFLQLPQNKKKVSRFGLTFSYLLILKDWCGGGDLNPYALRR